MHCAQTETIFSYIRQNLLLIEDAIKQYRSVDRVKRKLEALLLHEKARGCSHSPPRPRLTHSAAQQIILHGLEFLFYVLREPPPSKKDPPLLVPSFFHVADFLLAFINPEADNAVPFRCVRSLADRWPVHGRCARSEVARTRSGQMLEALLQCPSFRTLFPRRARRRASKRASACGSA